MAKPANIPAMTLRRIAICTMRLAPVVLLSAQAPPPPRLATLLAGPLPASPVAAPATIALDPALQDNIRALVTDTQANGREQGACVALAQAGLAISAVPPGDENRIAIRCAGQPGFVGDMHTHPTDDVAPSQTDLGNLVGAGKRFLLVADRSGRATLILDTAEGRRARGAKPNTWRAYNATGAASFVAASLVSGIDPAALGGFDAAADLADQIAIAGACRQLGFACYSAARPGEPFRRLSIEDGAATLTARASPAMLDDAMRRANAAVAWLKGQPIEFAAVSSSPLDLDGLWRDVATAPDLAQGRALLQTMRDRRLLPLQLGRARILWLDGLRLRESGTADPPTYRTINFDRHSGRTNWPMCVRTGSGVQVETAGRLGSTFVGELQTAAYAIQCVPRVGQPGMPVMLRQTIADGAIRTVPDDDNRPERTQTVRLEAMCRAGEDCVLSPATTTFTDQAPR